jgi:thymidylate synthase (FAD)
MSTTSNAGAGGSSHAFVQVVEMMGGDLAVVNSARVSYAKSSMELTEKDQRLIHRLLRDKHGTPFEQAVFTFYIKCPIFVAREWMRHRIGSFNEVSGRYKKLDTEYYTPRRFRMPDPDRVQMDYKYKDAPDDIDAAARAAVQSVYEYVTKTYDYLVDDLGIAKEHARIVVPVSIYTEFRWTVNARALMNFIALRTHPTAMREIRTYASGIEKMFADAMPVTHAAFVENGKVAP